MINDILKYYIETWGCQMNEEDSEKLSGMLINLGYSKTNAKESADVIIFNTCCVRENAEFKVYGNLGELKKLKKDKPSLIISVCGCMMQQEGMAEAILKKYSFVDIIFGTHNFHKFPEYLHRVLQEGKSIIEVSNREEGIIEGMPVERANNIKAYVTIMYGCNNFCTYCIVPFVRGRERSRKPIDIENEIKDLVKRGYKDITLLGQNVNSYGKDLEPKFDFSDLLRKVNTIPSIERVRFMTSHPKDLSSKVIDTIVECVNVCEHVHLPVQSGSSRLLKKMNRNYTREEYIALINEIRVKIPNVAITTDIIIGFPGESEEDLLETLSLVKEVQFDSAFTYIYSKRKGTPAYEMTDQIPEEIKHERFNRLVIAVNESCAIKNKEYEGNTVEVLVEGFSKNDKTKLTGRTRTSKVVNFTGSSEQIGKLINVYVTKANSFSLNGEKI